MVSLSPQWFGILGGQRKTSKRPYPIDTPNMQQAMPYGLIESIYRVLLSVPGKGNRSFQCIRGKAINESIYLCLHSLQKIQ